jgi:hypothetical protein
MDEEYEDEKPEYCVQDVKKVLVVIVIIAHLVSLAFSITSAH